MSVNCHDIYYTKENIKVYQDNIGLEFTQYGGGNNNAVKQLKYYYSPEIPANGGQVVFRTVPNFLLAPYGTSAPIAGVLDVTTLYDNNWNPIEEFIGPVAYITFPPNTTGLVKHYIVQYYGKAQDDCSIDKFSFKTTIVSVKQPPIVCSPIHNYYTNIPSTRFVALTLSDGTDIPIVCPYQFSECQDGLANRKFASCIKETLQTLFPDEGPYCPSKNLSVEVTQTHSIPNCCKITIKNLPSTVKLKWIKDGSGSRYEFKQF